MEIFDIPIRFISTAVLGLGILTGVIFQWRNTLLTWVEPVWQFMVAFSTTNTLGQFGLAGTVTFLIHRISSYMYSSWFVPAWQRMTCSVTMSNSDRNFHSVVDYISDNLLVHVQGGQSSLEAITQEKQLTQKDYFKRWLGVAPEIQPIDFRPSPSGASYKLRYKNQWIWLYRSREGSPLMGSNSSKPFHPETLTLSMWGRDNSLLKQLLQEAIQAKQKKPADDDTITIYVQSNGWVTGWEPALKKTARQLNSVILDTDFANKLIDDARTFLNSADKYMQRGIPYRRGYLLHGPPGCGKTSFAQVMAGELQLDICMLNLTRSDLDDDKLAEYLREAPARSIIMLEDVDAVFNDRSASATGLGGDNVGKKGTGVSFSGLLNALDGVAAQEGRLLYMTTNHIERLDPALIRPGRCDVKLEVQKASKSQLERMFLRFYPGESEFAKQFAANLPANELSMATLQGYLMNEERSAEMAVQHATDLLLARAGADSDELQVKPIQIYDGLDRVGLDKYAALFEFQGIKTMTDLTGKVSVDELCKMSPELAFDNWARHQMEKFLQRDQKFYEKNFALVESPNIREQFLRAFEIENDEDTAASNKLHRQTTLMLSSSSSTSPSNIQTGSSSPSLPSSSLLPSISTSALNLSRQHSVGEEELNRLSNEFAKALSVDNKGSISQFNLRQLLDSHPCLPRVCVLAAKTYMRPRPVDSHLIAQSDLFSFLCQAGCGDKINSFLHPRRPRIKKCECVPDLIALAKAKGGDSDLVDCLESDYEFETEQAWTLAEILNQKNSHRCSLINFELHQRTRVQSMVFWYFMEVKLTGKLPVDVTNNDDVKSDAKSESSASIPSASLSLKLERKLSDCSASVPESISTASALITENAVLNSPKATSKFGFQSVQIMSKVLIQPFHDSVILELVESELNSLAFAFAFACSDSRGRSKVSLLAVRKHLDLFGAHMKTLTSAELIASVETQLLNPKKPVYVKPAPPVPIPEMWVHEWLRSEGGDSLVCACADKFVDQAMGDKDCWMLFSEPIDDATLEKIGVSSLGNRRKVIAAHKKLLGSSSSLSSLPSSS